MHDTKCGLRIKTTSHQNWVPPADAGSPHTQHRRRGRSWPDEGQRCPTLAGMDRPSELWPRVSRSLTAAPALGARRLPRTSPLGISIQQSTLSCPLIDNADAVSIQEHENESATFTPLPQTGKLRLTEHYRRSSGKNSKHIMGYSLFTKSFLWGAGESEGESRRCLSSTTT